MSWALPWNPQSVQGRWAVRGPWLAGNHCSTAALPSGVADSGPGLSRALRAALRRGRGPEQRPRPLLRSTTSSNTRPHTPAHGPHRSWARPLGPVLQGARSGTAVPSLAAAATPSLWTRRGWMWSSPGQQPAAAVRASLAGCPARRPPCPPARGSGPGVGCRRAGAGCRRGLGHAFAGSASWPTGCAASKRAPPPRHPIVTSSHHHGSLVLQGPS